MGLNDMLGRLLPSSMSGGGPTAVFYETTIYEPDGEGHRFDFLHSTDWDRPVIVWNEREFHMPADPTFELDARGTTSLLGHEFDLLEVSRTPGGPRDQGDTVVLPAAFADRTIPELDRSEDELRTLFGE